MHNANCGGGGGTSTGEDLTTSIVTISFSLPTQGSDGTTATADAALRRSIPVGVDINTNGIPDFGRRFSLSEPSARVLIVALSGPAVASATADNVPPHELEREREAPGAPSADVAIFLTCASSVAARSVSAGGGVTTFGVAQPEAASLPPTLFAALPILPLASKGRSKAIAASQYLSLYAQRPRPPPLDLRCDVTGALNTPTAEF